MTAPLPPGSTIGILGGGQLARMLSAAASRLGLKCHIYEPDAQVPGGDVAHAVTTAPYTDEAALRALLWCGGAALFLWRRGDGALA